MAFVNKASGNERSVLVIYTGGTIGMVKNKMGALIPVPNRFLEEITNCPLMNDWNYCSQSPSTDPPLVLPSRNGEPCVLYRVLELNPLQDSSNMSLSDWIRVARQIENNYEMYDGFVVLHGTDTLAYTASALSFMLQNLGKTVVVTGSQVPIFETENDGLNNFRYSLVIAGMSQIPEVTVFFGDKLLRGNRTVKVHSINSAGAFDSPNYAPLATVVDDVICINSQQIFCENSIEAFSAHTELNHNVALLMIFPNISAAMIEAFVAPPMEGVVLLTFGAGNMPDQRPEVIAALAAASARGVLIVNCTQCFRGPVQPIYATIQALVDAGVIAGYDMTPEAALTKLCYVLSKSHWDTNKKRHMMETSIRGELNSPEKTDVIYS